MAAANTPTASSTAEGAGSFRDSVKPAILAFLIWALARLIFLTLRIRFEHYERIAEATCNSQGAIIVTWHGRSLILANVLHGRGYWALISLSRDGEIQNRIFRRLGFQTVRGSTGRGAVRAALQLARKIKEGGVLAFTPDGPRGPTHKVQGGTILFAQKSGRPILPVGVSAARRKLLRSWDRYLIPMPFSRAAVVIGEPIFVPESLDDSAMAEITAKVELEMNRAERRAEELMGHPYPDEYPV